MYPPAVYGTLAVFSSLISILLVVSTMRYELTIPIAEKDEDAEYLVILCFFILSIVTVIVFVFLVVWGDYLPEYSILNFLHRITGYFALGYLVHPPTRY